MNNTYQEGVNIDIVAPYTAASGTGVQVGAALFGIAFKDMTNGGAGVLVTRGVFELPKTASLAITAGDRIFWDNTNKVVNKTATSQLNIGVATKDAAGANATCFVRLGPIVPSGT